MSETTLNQPDELLLGFTAALRAAGLRVTPDRSRTFLEAVAAVGLDDDAGDLLGVARRLCAGPEDLEAYDQVFTAWFHEEPVGGERRRPQVTVVQAPLDDEQR